MTTTPQIADQIGAIVSYLAKNAGTFYNIGQMAKRFGFSKSAMALELATLAQSGRIRATLADNRAQAYYVPPQSQLDAEARMVSKVRVDRPLKINRRRQELYAELAEARNKIASIG